MALVAKEYGVLPSVAARDLDEDPEQLALACIPLLRYAEAKAAYDSGNKTTLKAWEGSQVMAQVQENAFAAVRASIERQKSEQGA